MIFGPDRISYDDFGDFHDEIAVAASISSANGQFIAFICKGRDASGNPLRGQRLRVIDLIVDRCGEEFKVSGWWICGLCCTRWCNCRYSFSDLDAIWTGSKVFDLAACPQCFRICCWIRHKDCPLALAFVGNHWGRRRLKNLDRILVFILVFYI